MNTTLALNIKKYRRQAGLTQQQVADKLNIKRTTYAYYETNKSAPSPLTIVKLAKIFKISKETLCENIENDPSVALNTV